MLNRNMPVTIFYGSKPLNDDGAWHQSSGFKEFSKIEMQVNFQGNNFVLPFYTQNKDTIAQSFSFTAFNTTDSKCRILAGRFLFAGRYITDIKLFMSLDLQSFAQIDSGTIWVQKIVGFR